MRSGPLRPSISCGNFGTRLEARLRRTSVVLPTRSRGLSGNSNCSNQKSRTNSWARGPTSLWRVCQTSRHPWPGSWLNEPRMKSFPTRFDKTLFGVGLLPGRNTLRKESSGGSASSMNAPTPGWRNDPTHLGSLWASGAPHRLACRCRFGLQKRHGIIPIKHPDVFHLDGGEASYRPDEVNMVWLFGSGQEPEASFLR